MRIVQGSRNFRRPKRPVVLTIGNFDGVHLGHQAILKRMAAASNRTGGVSVVYTFEPHPVMAIAPRACPKLLQTTEQKLRALKECGVDIVVIERFTRGFARAPAKKFFEDVVIKRLGPKQIVVGYDLTFGRHRLGNIELLEDWCGASDIGIEVVHPVFLGERLISSTQVRGLAAGGDVGTARNLLGRPYAICGRVVKGLGIGKVFGFHTANLAPDNELLPPEGVYITKTLGHASVTNIGFNPTFGGRSLTVETHILNFHKRIYGKRIEVQFYERLRDEKAFGNPLDLKRQVASDIEAAKRFFHGR
jgi:riboflavin kinase/FMN adenylyltransferase